MQQSNSWREANPEAAKLVYRRDHLKRNYGLTIEQYDEMLEAQSGGCAICGCADGDASGKRLAVDHDHATSENRGLLCQAHNQALGMFNDDPALLARAIEYLVRAR